MSNYEEENFDHCNKEEGFLERFANNNNNNSNNNANGNGSAACPYNTTPQSFTDYILDFGKKLLTNVGLFSIIFIVLFLRQNFFDAKSLPKILAFVVIISVLFCILQYLYKDINGFIIAGIGVAVGMTMFKDQFSTIFINNTSSSLN